MRAGLGLRSRCLGMPPATSIVLRHPNGLIQAARTAADRRYRVALSGRNPPGCLRWWTNRDPDPFMG